MLIKKNNKIKIGSLNEHRGLPFSVFKDFNYFPYFLWDHLDAKPFIKN